jgi:NADPH:quinone reductase-like Zn-dependent oxidoreductase
MIAEAPTSTTTAMKAIARRRFGGPEVLELRDVERPVPAADEVLVRVHAASLNIFDWHMLTGTPYLARLEAGIRKPKTELVGVDFAGTVESVGADVKDFQPGDEVFGGRNGSLAEFVPVRAERAIAHKPAGVSFEQAASIGIAGVTALQGLRDKGQLRPGERVLINGASGGVGTYAIQIAKSLGAEVTAVCSTHNVEQARALGADQVIDYKQEDFVSRGGRYDAILDIAGNRSWRESKRVLKDEGRLVVVGGPKKNRWIGPLGSTLATVLRSKLGSQRAIMFMANLNKDDLVVLAEQIEAGKITPAIDRKYELSEAAEALAYVGTGHAQGKVIVAVR